MLISDIGLRVTTGSAKREWRSGTTRRCLKKILTDVPLRIKSGNTGCIPVAIFVDILSEKGQLIYRMSAACIFRLF